jgi:4-diphosphocytidyl-2-C-methyl-D-erythritol kinase
VENSNLATINLKSYAKINLRLKIVGRNNFDYHLIELITAISNLSDDIALTPNLKDFDEITELKFSTNIYPFILNSKENSLTKALKLIREKVKVNTFYDITINKNIPAGGGLGGGSSNAATLIKYFSKLHQKNPYELFNKKEINNIGTDIHCFLDSSNLIFQKNIGDEVSSLKINDNSKLNKALLFFPKILSSSPLMYAKFKQLGEFSTIASVNLLYCI